MKKRYKYFCLLGFVTTFFSCQDYLDVNNSLTNPTNTGATFVVKFLGARNPGTTGGSYTFDGKIKEFAVYNAQLTGGNLTSLNSYLTGKFGL